MSDCIMLHFAGGRQIHIKFCVLYPWLYYITLGGIWHSFLCGIALIPANYSSPQFRFISLPICPVNHIKILADALHAFVKVPADFLTRCGKRLAVGFLPRGKGAVPLGGGTICRHIFKRDNLHLCGAGNAARLQSSSGAAPASTNYGRTCSWKSISGIRSWMGATESLGAVVRTIKQFTPFMVS